MIDGGKGICHDLRMGAPISSEVAAVASHNFPMFEAGYIVASASRNMCPDTT